MRRFAAFPPHPLRTRFSKEQLKLSSGGVAIIAFWNETVQDASGNPIAINLFKGAHTVAVTATASGGIRVYNAYNDGKRPREYECWEDYIKTGVFMCGYYIED